MLRFHDREQEQGRAEEEIKQRLSQDRRKNQVSRRYIQEDNSSLIVQPVTSSLSSSASSLASSTLNVVFVPDHNDTHAALEQTWPTIETHRMMPLPASLPSQALNVLPREIQTLVDMYYTTYTLDAARLGLEESLVSCPAAVEVMPFIPSHYIPSIGAGPYEGIHVVRPPDEDAEDEDENDADDDNARKKDKEASLDHVLGISLLAEPVYRSPSDIASTVLDLYIYIYIYIYI
jgi:hypothetical protein